MPEQGKVADQPTKGCYWVVASFTGLKAKTVLAQADHGIGYYILGQSTGEVTVAFRYAGPFPVPHHLTVVTDENAIAQYEDMRLRRQGLSGKVDRREAKAATLELPF